jgi:hypothetical protein
MEISKSGQSFVEKCPVFLKRTMVFTAALKEDLLGIFATKKTQLTCVSRSRRKVQEIHQIVQRIGLVPPYILSFLLPT